MKWSAKRLGILLNLELVIDFADIYSFFNETCRCIVIVRNWSDTVKYLLYTLFSQSLNETTFLSCNLSIDYGLAVLKSLIKEIVGIHRVMQTASKCVALVISTVAVIHLPAIVADFCALISQHLHLTHSLLIYILERHLWSSNLIVSPMIMLELFLWIRLIYLVSSR